MDSVNDPRENDAMPLCEYKDCGHLLMDHTEHGYGPDNLIGGACSKCNCPGYMRNGSIAMGG